VYERRNTIRGLKMIYEPKYLRFFQARFEQLDLKQDLKQTSNERRLVEQV
jgi:hypothetical protein